MSFGYFERGFRKMSLIIQSYFYELNFSIVNLLISNDSHNNLFDFYYPIFFMLFIHFMKICLFLNIQSAGLFIFCLLHFNQGFDFINMSGRVDLWN